METEIYVLCRGDLTTFAQNFEDFVAKGFHAIGQPFSHQNEIVCLFWDINRQTQVKTKEEKQNEIPK